MSGLVLYIFTPPPGVPFRFKSKSDATQPSQVTNSNHVTASCNAVTFATLSRPVSFARLAGVGAVSTITKIVNRVKVHSLSARPQNKKHGKYSNFPAVKRP